MKTASTRPDEVLESLLSRATHPTKRKTLELIHQVCQEQSRRSPRELSLKAVAAIVEERGGPKSKTLWNPQSGDYRELVAAWHAHAGGTKQRAQSLQESAEPLVRNVTDPALRIAIGRLIHERDKLRGEVNVLKTHANVVIDKRPQQTPHLASQGSTTVEIHAGPTLNAIEREALEHAVSEELWRAEGWREEKLGRVVRDLGDGRTRTVFKPGFVAAVRKFLRQS